MEFVPLFYYPTQVVWIDDDELFLQSAAQRFKDTFSIKFFLSPDECLTALRDYSAVSTSLPLLKICREYEEYGMADHLLADINLDSIYSLKNNEKRLQDISVMVVDYNMPGKTGIELCHELREWPIKKILLTGEASHQVAIDAFNEGAIDCFIRKDALTFSTDLTQYIQKFQLQYFIKLTDSLLSHLEADYKLPQSDPQFLLFLKNG